MSVTNGYDIRQLGEDSGTNGEATTVWVVTEKKNSREDLY